MAKNNRNTKTGWHRKGRITVIILIIVAAITDADDSSRLTGGKSAWLAP